MMSNGPLVSIVLPTHNRATVLPRAIQSVLDQSYKRFELIVIDDGSTDDTCDVVKSFGDPRIRLLPLEKNVGSSAARNRGLQMAKGSFVAFQDSDDVWYPEKLSRDIYTLESSHGRVGVCVCSYRHIIDDRTRVVIHPNGEVAGDEVIKRHLMGSAFSTQTLTIKKEAMDSVGGFDETLSCRQDWELCLRLAQKWSFVFVSDVLVDKWESSDSISADPFKLIDATQKIRQRHRHLFDRYPRGYSIQLYNAGKYLAFHRHHKTSMAYASRAIRMDPLNWRAYVLLAGVLTRTIPIMRRLKG
ncbi:MAG: glycosyltransferase family 2 protein [Candidatus Latescibacterota bacterium]|nr:MAG: glycosyltransferase family 2 protein [Candidatus Latescibacterota bacterium]